MALFVVFSPFDGEVQVVALVQDFQALVGVVLAGQKIRFL